MEILSDATFKGSLKIDAGSNVSKDLLVFENFNSDRTVSTGLSVKFDSESLDGSSCVLILDNKGLPGQMCLTVNGNINAYNLSVENGIYANYIEGVGRIIDSSGNVIYIPSTSGDLALTSDIPSLSDYQKKFTTFSSPSIPANCTAFEFTGTAISDSNKTHLIQVQNTSTGKSVIAETWMTTNKKPAMSFAGCTSTVAAGTYTAIVL